MGSRFLPMALAAAIGCSDRYNDDKNGAYGNGPTLGGCTDPVVCQQNAATAAQDIRASDPDFERRYLDGMSLEEALAEILTNGFVKRRRVRILKAMTVGATLRVYLSVQDAAGQPTADIEAVGLILKQGEKELKFEQMGIVPASDLSISTVMDYSGSMGGALPKLEAANVQLYESLSQAAFAVVKFANEAHVVAPMLPRDQGSGFEAVFTSSFPTGSTALFDGILAGIAAHRSPEAETGQSIDTLNLSVVFTDGVENASRTSYDDLKSELRNAKIPQIILGMGQVDIKSLLTLAEDTNGLFQFIADGAGIEGAMARVEAVASSIVFVEVPTSQDGVDGLLPEELVATFARESGEE